MNPILWEEITRITRERYPDNELMPVPGNGALNPRFMLIFINPTSRNISTGKTWTGPRFPFIGCRRPWDIFCKLGWISENTSQKIRAGNWSQEFADALLKELKTNGIYITNLVKNTETSATLPKSGDIRAYSDILKKEIALVNPQNIIAFGSMVTNAILPINLKMSEHYSNFRKTGKIQAWTREFESKEHKIIPCYYPIGRGEPKKAMEMLMSLSNRPSDIRNIH